MPKLTEQQIKDAMKNATPEKLTTLQWIRSHLIRMGFTKDWVPGHNVEIYGERLLRQFPKIGSDDFLWLCNQLSKNYKKSEYRSFFIFRLSKIDTKKSIAKVFTSAGVDVLYKELTNPKTKRSWLLVIEVARL